MTDQKRENLVQHLTVMLRSARDHALDLADTEDGGTCNFDAPYVHTDHPDALHEAAENVEGLRVSEGYGIAEGGYFVRGFLRGQGNRRSRMAEKAQEVLDDSPDLDAYMYRAMD